MRRHRELVVVVEEGQPGELLFELPCALLDYCVCLFVVESEEGL